MFCSTIGSTNTNWFMIQNILIFLFFFCGLVSLSFFLFLFFIIILKYFTQTISNSVWLVFYHTFNLKKKMNSIHGCLCLSIPFPLYLCCCSSLIIQGMIFFYHIDVLNYAAGMILLLVFMEWISLLPWSALVIVWDVVPVARHVLESSIVSQRMMPWSGSRVNMKVWS